MRASPTMRRLGSEMSSQFGEGFVDDLLAHRGMVEGNFKKAHDVFAAQAEIDDTYASESFYRAARASLWSGDAAEAKRLVALSEETGTSGATHEGRQGAINAGIAAVEKRPAEALTLYREALADLASGTLGLGRRAGRAGHGSVPGSSRSRCRSSRRGQSRDHGASRRRGDAATARRGRHSDSGPAATSGAQRTGIGGGRRRQFVTSERWELPEVIGPARYMAADYGRWTADSQPTQPRQPVPRFCRARFPWSGGW